MIKQPSSAEKLRILHVPIDQLNPAPYNPRKWSDKQQRDLKESIKRFGLVDPILINGAPKRRNVVIGGHFRLAMAKELGYETVPVVILNISDLRKEKELHLRLNRDQGEWDMDLLKSFDIGVLLDVGFDDHDLAAVWDDALAAEEDAFDVEKELEQIKKPKTKIGDLYQLGSHRLICGDSTDHTVVERLVGKERMDMIYIDTPYNISLDYNKGVGQKKQYGGKTNDKKSPEEYENFCKRSMPTRLP